VTETADTPAGKPAAVVGVDPSDVPLSERRPKLKPSEIWLRQGFEQAAVGFGMLDRAGHHVMVNAAYIELAGRPKSRVVGSTLAELLDNAATQEVRDWAQSPVQPLTVEATIARTDGPSCDVVVLLSPLTGNGSDGHVLVQLVAGDSWPSRRHSAARMTALADNIDELLVTTQANGAVTFVSTSVAEAIGRPAEQVVGLQFAELVHPDDFSRLDEALRTSRSAVIEIVMRWKVGDAWRPHRVRISEVRDQVGRLLGLAYVATPTSPGASLAPSQAPVVDELWHALPDAIWTFDSNGPTDANPTARALLGIGHSDSLDGVGLLDIFPRWAIERIAKQGVAETRSGHSWVADLALLDQAGNERPMSIALIASPNHDAQPAESASRRGGGEQHQNDHDAQPAESASRRGGGEQTKWTAVARTIAGDRTDAELRWAATHDPLTGLPGRVLVYDRLEVALSRATRTGQRVGLLVLDLDFFDVVNTAVGADIADRLLAGVAERLACSIRPGDTIGRMGDDEFVVLCEHFDQLDDAERFAERLLRSVEEPIELDGADWFMSMSVGISVARPGLTNADSLLRSADTAMYRAKELGRGRHVVFGKGLQTPQLPFAPNRQIG